MSHAVFLRTMNAVISIQNSLHALILLRIAIITLDFDTL